MKRSSGTNGSVLPSLMPLRSSASMKVAVANGRKRRPGRPRSASSTPSRRASPALTLAPNRPSGGVGIEDDLVVAVDAEERGVEIEGAEAAAVADLPGARVLGIEIGVGPEPGEREELLDAWAAGTPRRRRRRTPPRVTRSRCTPPRNESSEKSRSVVVAASGETLVVADLVVVVARAEGDRPMVRRAARCRAGRRPASRAPRCCPRRARPGSTVPGSVGEVKKPVGVGVAVEPLDARPPAVVAAAQSLAVAELERSIRRRSLSEFEREATERRPRRARW